MPGVTVDAVEVDPETDQAALPNEALLLIAALAAGLVAQGGYYPTGRLLLTALTAAAVALAIWRHPRWPRGLAAVALPAGALALWAVVRTVPAGGIAQPVAAATALGCVVAALFVLAWCDAPTRELVAQVLVWAGALIAVTAWLGVAWRVNRFAVLVEHRLWRGASTLTYPNAAAAVLVPLSLLAVAVVVARPRTVSWAMAGYLLLVGVGATLSRAGFIALLAGCVVLAVLGGGVWRVAWRALPLLLGAGLALAALVPSFPAGTPPQPGRALLGLLAGAVVALGPPLLPHRIRAGVLGLLMAAGLMLGGWLGRDRLADVWANRGTLDSSGRTGALHAALEMVHHQPWTGTGVGRARFIWATPDGNGAVALYLHNEYGQVLVDLGVIGALLLLGLLVAIGAYLYRGRYHPGDPAGPRSGVRAGAIAAVAAFAVHSAFDFLWHIPALLLAAGLFIGLAGPVPHSHLSVHSKRGST